MTEAAGGMDVAGFARLNEIEAGNFWFEPRNRLIVGLLDKYSPQATSFMEIGCGTGFVLSAISSARNWRRLIGSELHEEGLVYARRRLGSAAELIQLDARKIPSTLKVDAVGVFDVLEHIPEDEAVLTGISEALAPGGGLLVTVPQHRWLWSDVDVKSHHVRRYNAKELHAKLEAAGFRIEFSGSYAALLLPLMIASRWSKSDGKSEFSPPPIINAALRAVLTAEVMLTLSGVRFPVGGSRVLVAVKR